MNGHKLLSHLSQPSLSIRELLGLGDLMLGIQITQVKVLETYVKLRRNFDFLDDLRFYQEVSLLLEIVRFQPFLLFADHTINL